MDEAFPFQKGGPIGLQLRAHSHPPHPGRLFFTHPTHRLLCNRLPGTRRNQWAALSLPREVPRRPDDGSGATFAVALRERAPVMLKFITLAVCVVGFFFLGPKALAEFRQLRPRTRTPLDGNVEIKDSGDDPQSGVAA